MSKNTAVRVLFALTLSITGVSVMHAQWLKLPLPDTPRNADATPNLNAPAPHTADGHTDLTGIWRRIRDDAKLMNDLGATSPHLLMQPSAAALYARRSASGGAGRPSERCLPDSAPDGLLLGAPFKIIQTPKVTLILYEQENHYRQLFTDGRAFPNDYQPTWLGYSTAKWEGDTLVAETVGLNEQTWLDVNGHPHSDALHLTERFHRLDFGHMQVQFTIDDPKMYKKLWSATVRFELLPDTELIENICENEKDAEHIARGQAK